MHTGITASIFYRKNSLHLKGRCKMKNSVSEKKKTVPRRMKSSHLYVQAKLEIIRLIKENVFVEGKLPSETMLSDMLGISRTSIREALMALGRDGIISKKQGIGNFIHLSALNTRMRIDQIQDFPRLLEDGGYKVTVKRIKFTWTDDLSGLSIKTPVHEDKRFLLNEILYYADNRPAIMSIMLIPESVLNKPKTELTLDAERKKAIDKTLGDFLNSHTIEEVSHSISVYSPKRADEETSSLLGIEEGDPIIEWEEIYYGIKDTPLCFTRIMFHPDLVHLSSICKWN
jgi:GntR family transcriptional regulator